MNNLRERSALIHNITNYVTVNDVANMLLACGASPIMADEPDEVYDITSICGGLNINIGTLNKRSIEAMFVAGRRANELGHVVLLDPVGAGASALRTETALSLVDELRKGLRGKEKLHRRDNGRDRSGRRRAAVLCHTQRQTRDEQDHGNRLPALRYDDRLRHGKPGK